MASPVEKKAPAFKLMTQKEFDSALDIMSKSTAELNEIIQKLAVHAIGHSILNNQTTPANRLAEKWGEGLRKQAVITFLERHGQLEWVTKPGQAASFGFRRREGLEFKPEELMDAPWHKARAEGGVVSIYDCEEQVQKFLKSVMNRTKGRKDVKNVSLATYIQDAYDLWKEAQADLRAGKPLTPEEQADAALAEQMKEGTAGEYIEEKEKESAPQRRVTDRKVANIH